MAHNWNETFSRDELYALLKELANEIYKRTKGNATANIYICGGAAVMLQFNSRGTTQDVDGTWGRDRTIKECINKVADKHGITREWCNDDVVKSKSFTPKIYTNSSLLVSLRGLNIYVANPDLLLSMKLISFRLEQDKHDFEDIIAIIEYLRGTGLAVTRQWVVGRLVNYYGLEYSEKLSQEAREFIWTL